MREHFAGPLKEIRILLGVGLSRKGEKDIFVNWRRQRGKSGKRWGKKVKDELM